LSLLILVALLGVTAYQMAREKGKAEKVWFALTLLLFFSILFFQNMLWRYLFATAIMVIFSIIVTFMKRKTTALLLVVVAIVLFAGSPLFNPAPKSARTLKEIESIADHVLESSLVDKDKRLAVVSAVTEKTEVPQADDYRFLLRNRGYTVLEVTEHAQAELMLYVIEVSDFKWQDWSNWEIESFGDKKLSRVEKLDENLTLVMYERSQ
jgi:signal transduction histidine kinase